MNHDEDDTVTLQLKTRPRLAHAGLALLCGALLAAGCSGGGGSKSDAGKPATKAGVSPSTAAGLLDQALKEQAQGHNDVAKKDYQALLEKDPNNKFAYYNLGVIAQLGGDNATAADNYSKTLSIDPAYDPALYNLAILTDKQGDAQGAAALYRRAIKANPKDAKAHFNLGLLLRRLGDAKGAVAELNAAHKIDPSLKV